METDYFETFTSNPKTYFQIKQCVNLYFMHDYIQNDFAQDPLIMN